MEAIKKKMATLKDERDEAQQKLEEVKLEKKDLENQLHNVCCDSIACTVM